MDKDQSLEATGKIIDAVKKDATVETHINLTPASLLAEVSKCDEVELIKANSEAQLRSHALVLSSVCTILIVIAQIYFSYINKTLVIPDILWVIVLSPWVGIGSAKAIETITTILRKPKI